MKSAFTIAFVIASPIFSGGIGLWAHSLKIKCDKQQVLIDTFIDAQAHSMAKGLSIQFDDGEWEYFPGIDKIDIKEGMLLVLQTWSKPMYVRGFRIQNIKQYHLNE
jgi:hypothetical protein